MQPNMNIQIGEQTEKAIGEAVSNVSGDVTKGIGKTLGDIWFIALGGVSQFAEKKKLKYACDLALLKKELDKKVEEIPPEKRIEPQLQVVGPALEKAKYCVEEPELRSMFANLISSAINADKVSKVQPCFSSVIEQMTPVDAKNIVIFHTHQSLPIASYMMNLKPTGYRMIQKNVFLENPDISNVAVQAISISNLERLGLISLDYLSSLTNEELYQKFYETTLYKDLQAQIEVLSNVPDEIKKVLNVDRADIMKGIATLTPLGSIFKEVCLP